MGIIMDLHRLSSINITKRTFIKSACFLSAGLVFNIDIKSKKENPLYTCDKNKLPYNVIMYGKIDFTPYQKTLIKEYIG